LPILHYRFNVFHQQRQTPAEARTSVKKAKKVNPTRTWSVVPAFLNKDRAKITQHELKVLTNKGLGVYKYVLFLNGKLIDIKLNSKCGHSLG
jgi:hypothetical protein